MQEGKWQMIINFNKKFVYYSEANLSTPYNHGNSIVPIGNYKNFSFSIDAAVHLNNFLYAYNFISWKEKKLHGLKSDHKTTLNSKHH